MIQIVRILHGSIRCAAYSLNGVRFLRLSALKQHNKVCKLNQHAIFNSVKPMLTICGTPVSMPTFVMHAMVERVSMSQYTMTQKVFADMVLEGVCL